MDENNLSTTKTPPDNSPNYPPQPTTPAPNLNPTPNGTPTPQYPNLNDIPGSIQPTPQKKSNKKNAIITAVALLVLVIVGLIVFLNNPKTEQTSTNSPAVNSEEGGQTRDNFSTETNATDEAGITAASYVTGLSANLEAFFAKNDFYPAELVATDFPDADSSLFTAPEGTKYVYSPMPENCTTADKNCTSFSLSAQRLDGTVISFRESL